MNTVRKLEMIIELLEAKEVGIAYFMVQQWGKLYVDASPVIGAFIRNDERMYWLEYEPMLSDLKTALVLEAGQS